MAPAITDLVGGHVDVLVASVPSVMQQVKTGNLRALGITSGEPSPAAPGLAPLAGAGAKGYRAELWWGILAPGGVPRDIVNRLNAEINKALSTAEMKEFLLREGAEPAPVTPDQFAHLIKSEIQAWQKVARDAGIKGE